MLKPLVFEEKNDTFSCYVTSSKSEDYLFIGSYSTLTTEFQYLDAATPLEDFQYIQERIPALEYSISHYGDHFYIFTNADGARTIKSWRLPLTKLLKAIGKKCCASWGRFVGRLRIVQRLLGGHRTFQWIDENSHSNLGREGRLLSAFSRRNLYCLRPPTSLLTPLNCVMYSIPWRPPAV